MRTFLPLRLLSFSLPPFELSSSKSGALSPTWSALARADVKMSEAATNRNGRIFLRVFIILSLVRRTSEKNLLSVLLYLLEVLHCQRPAFVCPNSPRMGINRVPHGLPERRLRCGF